MVSDLVERLVGIADASRRRDGSDIPLGEYIREAAARIAELEAENQRLRNRAQAEGFWLGKTTEKEVKP
jgi:hypothetical protein